MKSRRIAKLAIVGVVCAISGATVFCQNAAAEHFAAIWAKDSGPQFVARHGLTAAQYQTEFDTQAANGFRLKLVDGYSVGGQDRYAAIWEKASGPQFVARHGLTAAQYQTEFDANVANGFRLTHVSGYDVGGQPRFAAIWAKDSGPQFVARHGLTAGQYQTEFDTQAANGFRLKLVDGYRDGGQDRYAAIWEKASGPQFVARHGLTAAQYQTEFDTHVGNGFRLTGVSGF